MDFNRLSAKRVRDTEIAPASTAQQAPATGSGRPGNGRLDVAFVYTNVVHRFTDGRVDGFEWDQGNIDHCRKHGVPRTEIEDLFARPVTILPDAGHSRTERRFRAIGRTGDGRAIFLVFTIRKRDERR